ncbi:MAG: bacitracin resistance protein [Microbacterium sp.]
MSDTAAKGGVRRRMPTWLIATISGGFGLFYAYAVWNAIGNLVEANAAASAVGVSLNAVGWLLWIFAAVFPIVVWGVSFAIGARRAVHELALVMLAGLSIVAVFWLDVVAYSALNTSSLIG